METINTPAQLSAQDERVMAALSHISILLPMIGVIAPIVIWVTQRERSRYVAFQALQAVVFQLALVALWILGMACYMGTFFAVFVGGMAASGGGPSAGPAVGLFILPFLVMGSMFLLMAIFMIYGLVATVMTFQGKYFRYALVGTWVARYRSPNHTPATT